MASDSSASNETPIVFLPGTLCDERIWHPLYQELGISQAHYVALETATSLAEMLSLTEALLANIEQSVILVGFSMGGYIAALSALNESLRTKIEKVVLIAYNPYGLSKRESAARDFILKMASANSVHQIPISSARMAQYFTPQELDSPELTRPIINMQNTLGIQVLLQQVRSTSPRKDLSENLFKLDIPQYWVVGEYDNIAQADAIKHYCDNCPHANFTLLTNTSHILPLTRSKELAHLLRKIAISN